MSTRGMKRTSEDVPHDVQCDRLLDEPLLEASVVLVCGQHEVVSLCDSAVNINGSRHLAAQMMKVNVEWEFRTKGP